MFFLRNECIGFLLFFVFSDFFYKKMKITIANDLHWMYDSTYCK